MDFIHLEEVDSTQVYARQHLSEYEKGEITCIRCEHQTAGRGPRKTHWECPKGEGLLVSYVIWHPSKPQLAQVISIAIAKVCIELGLAPQLKWPNDVLLSQKKCGGCMVETADEGALIIGIGINVLQSENELSRIDQPATSLAFEYGKPLDIEYIFERLSYYVETELALFYKEGFSPFYQLYTELLQLSEGDSISIRVEGKNKTVLFKEIQKDGRLVIFSQAGDIQIIG